MRILFTFFLLFSNLAFACDTKVPIEVSFEFDKKPAETEVGYLKILAPLKFNDLNISGVEFSKGKNVIPIMKYVSEEEFPGRALFEVAATLEFLRGSKFTASYTQSGTLCLHTQEIEIKI
jgi:hypothetical protein